MGTAVSRDHAKLPFGYTHARKDHSCNNSSVSRRRLARLLRTNDTVSVTPFPVDNASSSPSIPAVEYNHNHNHDHNHINISLPPNGGHPSTIQSNYTFQTSNHSNRNHNDLNGHNQADLAQVDISGTGAGTGAGTGTGTGVGTQLELPPESGTPIVASTSSPDSDSQEARFRAVATRSHTHGHAQEHTQAHAHAHSYSHGSKADLASNSSAGSLVRSSSNHAAMTNLDLAHANHSNHNHNHNYSHGSSAQGSSYSSFVQGSSSSLSIPRHKQLGQSRVQTSDMDIISALGIADRPYESSSYAFFGGSSSPPTARAPSGHHQQPHQPSLHLHKDLFTSLPRLTSDMDETGASHPHPIPLPLPSTNTNPFLQYHKGKALSYEIKDDEHQDQDQDEDTDGDNYGYGYDGDAQSILDEELDLLSPIPFSELPSLTNIGLCSQGIVKLSSNIRFLGSATCVQM